MLKLTLLCVALAAIHVQGLNNDWWKDAVIYQIYPRSFKDSNGDGIGDLEGITNKLQHIKDIGATAFWLSPIYPSPQIDTGYDIVNHTEVNPEFGTLSDFDILVAKAKSMGLRVILDFVPNYNSDQHPWFKKSIQRIKPYDEFYIWKDAKVVDGVKQPPNNWLSVFGGSAWEWNDERGQYYYHQFASRQPGVNYRSKDLQKEMLKVLTFWMDRGVDGYRIDAVNWMFVNENYLDEPKSNKDVPADDTDYFDHIYTQNQPEIFSILRSWRELLDDYAHTHQTDAKFLVAETYVDPVISQKYFDVGSNPFNFMFLFGFSKTPSAVDFKRTLDYWFDNLSEGNVSNWVTGNHDNHRIATRYGSATADMIIMLSMVLPGFVVVYNGDEIGMTDRKFSWKETVDVSGCNAGPKRFFIKSRDPERTPFQWDNTTSAGFSTNKVTWLPVNKNYKTLNLEAQKDAPVSNYKLFKAMANLKKMSPVLRKGSVDVILINENVLGVVRRLKGSSPVVLLMNTAETEEVVDASTWLNIPNEMIAYATNVDSEMKAGTLVITEKLKIPASTTVVLMAGLKFYHQLIHM